jgi:hypothetical protein
MAQGEELSSSDDKPGRASGRATTKPKSAPPSREQEMGHALRSVYQKAVDERIPDDLMDLLGKLD